MVRANKDRLTIANVAESGECSCPTCSSQDIKKEGADDFKTEEKIMDTFLDAILDRIEDDKKKNLIPKRKEN